MPPVMTSRQAAELDYAFERNKWSAKDVKELCKGFFLWKFLQILNGGYEDNPIKCIIDCDASPYIEKGWEIEEHRKGGMLKWDPKRIKFFQLSEEDGKIECHELRKRLISLSILNANVLDWLWAYPIFIPKEWKGECIFFWGTIYNEQDRKNCLAVRYLDLRGKPAWGYYWFDGDQRDGCPIPYID